LTKLLTLIAASDPVASHLAQTLSLQRIGIISKVADRENLIVSQRGFEMKSVDASSTPNNRPKLVNPPALQECCIAKSQRPFKADLSASLR